MADALRVEIDDEALSKMEQKRLERKETVMHAPVKFDVHFTLAPDLITDDHSVELVMQDGHVQVGQDFFMNQSFQFKHAEHIARSEHQMDAMASALASDSFVREKVEEKFNEYVQSNPDLKEFFVESYNSAALRRAMVFNEDDYVAFNKEHPMAQVTHLDDNAKSFATQTRYTARFEPMVLQGIEESVTYAFREKAKLACMPSKDERRPMDVIEIEAFNKEKGQMTLRFNFSLEQDSSVLCKGPLLQVDFPRSSIMEDQSEQVAMMLTTLKKRYLKTHMDTVRETMYSTVYRDEDKSQYTVGQLNLQRLKRDVRMLARDMSFHVVTISELDNVIHGYENFKEKRDNYMKSLMGFRKIFDKYVHPDRAALMDKTVHRFEQEITDHKERAVKYRNLYATLDVSGEPVMDVTMRAQAVYAFQTGTPLVSDNKAVSKENIQSREIDEVAELLMDDVRSIDKSRQGKLR